MVLAGLSSLAGLVLSATAVGFSQNPSLFTSDAVLWPIIRSHAPYVAAALPLLGIAQVHEGPWLEGF